METMTSSSHYNDLSEFLSKHYAKKTTNEKINLSHTRIGNEDLNVYGGSYLIENNELATFRRLYYEHVFVKNRKEYLTEKQLDVNGPILVDFDFRYDYSVTTRIHTIEHIQDMISLYLEELKELLVFEENKQFPIFIMEKPYVNRVVDKEVTKDGIHMIIGIQMDRTLQMILRDKIIAQIGDVWELPLTNDWNEVLDEGISKGCVNWQMYGSQKPGFDAYKLTYYLEAELDTKDNNWMTTAKCINDIDLSKDLYLLSAQYDNHIKCDLNPKILDEYNKRLETKNNKVKKNSAKGKINIILDEEEEGNIQLSDITNIDILKKAVDNSKHRLQAERDRQRKKREMERSRKLYQNV